MRVGTPDYMSPEQALGESVDARSDLFSFGILLAELLTGSHPFRRTTAETTIAAIVRDPPVLPSDRRAFPPAMGIIVRRLLAKMPAERYQSITDVRRDLALYTGCVAGAATVDEAKQWLADAGFVDIEVKVNQAATAAMAAMLPGDQDLSKLGASASIEGRRPVGGAKA